MPQLEQFLKKHFNTELQEEISNLIHELSMRKYFNNTIMLLDNPEIPKNEVAIATVSSSLLRNINYKLGRFQTIEEKISRQRIFGILFERLLVSFISKNIREVDKIFSSMESSLYITCLQQGYDHNLMKKLFDFEGLKHVLHNLRNQELTVTLANNQKIQKYVWLNKGNLPELVDILLKNNYIKSKKEFFDLFLKPDEIQEIRWSKDKKQHLALLLNRLFTEGFAKIEGNKGYFSFAEKHFTSFEKVPFAVNSLKKLSSLIAKNPSAYSIAINEVNDILKQISK